MTSIDTSAASSHYFSDVGPMTNCGHNNGLSNRDTSFSSSLRRPCSTQSSFSMVPQLLASPAIMKPVLNPDTPLSCLVNGIPMADIVTLVES